MANLFKSFLNSAPKPTLAQLTQQLKEELADLESSGEALKVTINSFFDLISQSEEKEVNEAIRSLSDLFFLDEESRSTTAMMICGYLIEQGHNPQLISDRIIEKLTYLTESAYPFYLTFKAVYNSESEDESSNVLENLKEKYWEEMTDAIISWNAIEEQYTPAVSVFSLDYSQCLIAKNTLKHITEMAVHNQGCYWLQMLFDVLHNAPILVIEPSTQLGFIGKVSGVVDNFQLQALLMDSFPQKGPYHARLTQTQADVFKGIGPQSQNGSMVCYWNMYNWQATTKELSLPDIKQYSSSTHWIWGEGKPADIQVLDGYRVILLGEASYSRSTNLQRTFNHLKANLMIEKELNSTEVHNWLSRMYNQTINN